MLTRPPRSEYPSSVASYVHLPAPTLDPVRALARQRDLLVTLVSISDRAAAARYAPGKWSVKEVIGHLSDAERVFAYRLLRMARGDRTPLQGFSEEVYARRGGHHARTLGDLWSEWVAVRDATIALVRGLPPPAWTRRGIANASPISVRALVYVIVGHTEHHRALLVSRYGLGAPSLRRMATR